MHARVFFVRWLGGLTVALTVVQAIHAQAVTYSFGSGTANAFAMDFVKVGNPANAPDISGLPSPAGAVSYPFLMGKYEVSEDMVTKANALGSLGITMQVTRGPNKPATYITWNEAARFVNWLNTSHGFGVAYKFSLQPGDVGYDSNQNVELWSTGESGFNPVNPYRNMQAHFVLPSEDEWYKAAYYDGVAGLYYDYPTGSDTVPTAVVGGTSPGTAVCGSLAGLPADINDAGGLSPYGTMAQGGNVREWMESAFDQVNDSPTEVRTHRGAYYGRPPEQLSASQRLLPNPGVETGDNCNYPTYERYSIGFRVAIVPEPAQSAAVVAVMALGFTFWRRLHS